jgi:hypothetical protein
MNSKRVEWDKKAYYKSYGERVGINSALPCMSLFFCARVGVSCAIHSTLEVLFHLHVMLV